jgi:DNA repair protein RecO (recombination protein O)
VTPRRAPSGPLPAYVLHSHDWSETSLIVELFIRERGRVVVVAKGAKRPYSQQRSVLLPFQRLLVQLGRAPADEAAEVHTLRSAEWAGGLPSPGGAALFAGFYVNELLLRLLARQDPHPSLFDEYADTITALADAGDGAREVVLRAFELALLRELGVLPELGLVTQAAQAVSADGLYTLDAEAGVLAVPRGQAGVPGAALVAIEAALLHGGGAALRAAAAPVVGELRPPLRQVLHYHLGSSTLRTRAVMQGVKSLLDPAFSPVATPVTAPVANPARPR